MTTWIPPTFVSDAAARPPGRGGGLHKRRNAHTGLSACRSAKSPMIGSLNFLPCAALMTAISHPTNNSSRSVAVVPEAVIGGVVGRPQFVQVVALESSCVPQFVQKIGMPAIVAPPRAAKLTAVSAACYKNWFHSCRRRVVGRRQG